MPNFMRTTLLLIILFLVSAMAWEFSFFAQHYEALEKLNDKVMKDCK